MTAGGRQSRVRGRVASRTAGLCTLGALVLAAGGCGSEGGSRPPARLAGPVPAAEQPAAVTPTTAQATVAADPARLAAQVDRRVAAAERRARRRGAAVATARASARVRNARRRAERLLATAARRSASALARASGYEGATVVVSGARVEYGIPAAEACSAPATGPRSLAALTRAALPRVRRVSVTVAEAGRSLAPYAAGRCSVGALPATPRPLVPTSGSGAAETGLFRVGRGSWAVDYATSGSFLEVLVLEDAETLSATTQQKGPGNGKLVFDGPGTFALRIAGDGRWKVQVRRAG